MVKKLIQPHGSRILTVHLIFPEYELIEYPCLLGPPAALETHCLFPDDDVPFGVKYRGSKWGETRGKGGPKL